MCTGREGIPEEEEEERGRGSAETIWCEGGSTLRDGERCMAGIIMGPSTLIVGLSGRFKGVHFLTCLRIQVGSPVSI